MMHVVIGSQGEYSDREEYVAGVFTDLEVAKKLIIEKAAVGRRRAHYVEYDKFYVVSVPVDEWGRWEDDSDEAS
jgi:hypothetical protein